MHAYMLTALCLLHSVGACLHACEYLQVIPRLNPIQAPTPSYVSEDRSRLLLRLDMYGLQERQVKGDGNCQVIPAACGRAAWQADALIRWQAAPEHSCQSLCCGGLHGSARACIRRVVDFPAHPAALAASTAHTSTQLLCTSGASSACRRAAILWLVASGCLNG